MVEPKWSTDLSDSRIHILVISTLLLSLEHSEIGATQNFSLLFLTSQIVSICLGTVMLSSLIKLLQLFKAEIVYGSFWILDRR